MSCTCDSNGSWACTGTSCPPPECPPGPTPGAACYYEGQSCGFGSNGGGCGETCQCEPSQGPGGPLTWQCYAPPCPPPACPPSAPQPGTACYPAGDSCDYDNGGCFEQCTCDPSGIWSCFTGSCIDAGPVDAGSFDAGWGAD